jgi:hypothetical protein
MGLMGSLKKATGIGLSANEHYDRAYEKAVLLGPANYPKAVELFQVAAAKAGEAGDAQTQARSRANAALYSFITTGNEQSLNALRETLPLLQEIEQIGLRTETMATAPLLAEVEARLTECALSRARDSGHRALSGAHAACADSFHKLSNAQLITYQHQATDQHRDTALSRFFFHQGMASWHEASAVVGESPETAAEHMAKALNAFRQCGDENASQAQTWLTNCRLKRTCWMCHREFQGATIHFRTFRSSVTPYAESVVRQLGQDVSMIDLQGETVTLCGPCGSMVENVADQFAVKRMQELRSEVKRAVDSISDALAVLSARVERLESAAHRH